MLKKLKALGFTRICSSNLADSLGVSASLVRKDFSVLATSGNKRGGYQIDLLLEEFNRYLHKDKVTKAVLAGVGMICRQPFSFDLIYNFFFILKTINIF